MIQSKRKKRGVARRTRGGFHPKQREGVAHLKGGFLPSIMEGFCTAASRYIVPISLFALDRMLRGPSSTRKGKKRSKRSNKKIV